MGTTARLTAGHKCTVARPATFGYRTSFGPGRVRRPPPPTAA